MNKREILIHQLIQINNRIYYLEEGIGKGALINIDEKYIEKEIEMLRIRQREIQKELKI